MPQIGKTLVPNEDRSGVLVDYTDHEQTTITGAVRKDTFQIEHLTLNTFYIDDDEGKSWCVGCLCGIPVGDFNGWEDKYVLARGYVEANNGLHVSYVQEI